MDPKKHLVRPEDEDRRTDERPATPAKKSRVESLPDGEKAASEEAKKARDD